MFCLLFLLLATSLPCGANEATDAIHALALSLETWNVLPSLWDPRDTDPASICAWPGVKCSTDNSSVKSLNLTGVPMHRVHFRTFEVLNRCPELEHILLAGTGITGHLNARWKNISSLRHVDLGFNLISGTLPTGFRLNGNLQVLCLQYNQLSGALPRAWRWLRNLTHLWLAHNRFTGTIPSAWQEMEALQDLQLGSNQLTGSLPFSSLPRNLAVLSLWGNGFNGSLPPAACCIGVPANPGTG